MELVDENEEEPNRWILSIRRVRTRNSAFPPQLRLKYSSELFLLLLSPLLPSLLLSLFFICNS